MASLTLPRDKFGAQRGLLVRAIAIRDDGRPDGEMERQLVRGGVRAARQARGEGGSSYEGGDVRAAGQKQAGGEEDALAFVGCTVP
jgi:hypothetical protein